MRIRTFRTVLWALITIGVALPQSAAADSSVIVLGVRSLDGDDELARSLSTALRKGAGTVSGWGVSERDVSLAQMSLAHGCDDPDARCMADIAQTLKVDRLIYGTMLAASKPGKVELSLFNFDAVTGAVETSLKETIDTNLKGAALNALMRRFANQLAGNSASGSLEVKASAPGAKVMVDGRQVGILDAEGSLTVAEVAAGTHTVSIEGPDGRYEEEVSISAGQRTTIDAAVIDASPTPSSEVGADRLIATPGGRDAQRTKRVRNTGWAMLGVAVAGAAATAGVWLKIRALDNDSDLVRYRNAFDPPGTGTGGVSDVCAEARNGSRTELTADDPGLIDRVIKVCDDAEFWQGMQWAPIGLTVAGGALAAYFLVVTRKKGDKAEVSWAPALSPQHAGLQAEVRF